MATNPYQSPQSGDNGQIIGKHRWLTLFFTFDGRVGRLWYFLLNLFISIGMFTLFLIPFFIVQQVGESSTLVILLMLPILLIIIAGAWTSFCIAGKRLHDLGHSGIWVLLGFVPLIGTVYYLYILFAPGQDGENEYGPQVDNPFYTNSSQEEYHQNPNRLAELELQADANPTNLDIWNQYFDDAYAHHDKRHLGKAGRKLQQMYLKKKDPEAAFQVWEEMREYGIHGSYVSLYRLADSLVQQGKMDEASGVLGAIAVSSIPLEKMAELARLAIRIDRQIAVELLDQLYKGDLPPMVRNELDPIYKQLKATISGDSSSAQNENNPFATALDKQDNPFADALPLSPEPITRREPGKGKSPNKVFNAKLLLLDHESLTVQ